jgi:hypothetical protein
MLKRVGSLVIFHVTPAENIPSIHLQGICPSYAKGKMQASWYVSKQRIEWALIHTSVAHHVSIDELAVCAVLAESEDLYKFFRPGYYYSYRTLRIESATPAMFFLHNMGEGEINEQE